MRSRYEDSVRIPTTIINMVTMAIVVFNLVFPVFDGEMGWKVIGQWVVVGLSITLCIGVNGGLGSLFIVKSQPFPAGTYLLVRVLELVLVWVFYGFDAISLYFWLLLLLDALLLFLVYRSYTRFEFVEEEVYIYVGENE